MGIRTLLVAAAVAASPAARAGIRPVQLRCEHLADPVGIDARVPRFSWSLESDGRGEIQTAYRILVASAPEKLAADEGDLWDSGEVASGESILVPYAGIPLGSRIRAHWKVRVRDRANALSAWSEPARFSMGLLEPGDWRARWIGGPGSVPLFRKAFSIAGPIRRATLYATALGLYEIRLNGERVGRNVLAPEWTDYAKRVQYQTYDVTALLREGENAIGAILADGWYAGRIGISHVLPGKPVRGFYGTRPRLLAQLEIERADGAREMIATDGAWRATAEGPIRRSCLLDGEEQDLRRSSPGWDCPGFDDAAWGFADVADRIDARLVAQPNEPIRIVEERRPIALTSPAPGVFIFDIGQNLAGWCRLRTRGSEGTAVTLRHAEVLNPDGTLYVDNLRMRAHGDPFGARQTDRFILRGDGAEILEPRFTLHGFRYVEVTGLEARPALEDLLACAVHSDVARAGSFSSSDPELDRLLEAIAWTQRSNLHGISTDCPQRDERLGWLGDAQVFSQTACFLFDMAAFYTKWVRDIRDAQADDGRFPDFAPHPFDPNARFSGAPGWADGGVSIPWRAYVNYADRRILEEHYESARRWVEYVRGRNPDLIWSRARGNDYGDWLNGDTLAIEGWPRAGGRVPNELLATAFFAHSTDLVARMAGVLGLSEDEARYAGLARGIREAFLRAFVDPEGRVKGDTQAGYALALHFDLVRDPAMRRAFAARLVEGLEPYRGHLSTGIQTTGRAMLELSRNGYDEIAYRILGLREVPSWRAMLAHGATTIWERWDGFVEGRGFQDPGMNSFNHYAFGAVGEWIVRSIAGIEPDETQPGYRHVIIRPRPGGGLSSASFLYRSIRGPILVAWRIEGSDLALEVEIPANARATVHVPAKDPRAVTEGRKPARDAEGVEFLRAEAGAAIFRIGSGRYRFAVRG